jgi:hypothetical protein
MLNGFVRRSINQLESEFGQLKGLSEWAVHTTRQSRLNLESAPAQLAVTWSDLKYDCQFKIEADTQLYFL